MPHLSPFKCLQKLTHANRDAIDAREIEQVSLRSCKTFNGLDRTQFNEKRAEHTDKATRQQLTMNAIQPNLALPLSPFLSLFFVTANSAKYRGD